MNKRQEEIAKAAQESNPKGWTIEDFFDAVYEGIRSEKAFMVHVLDGIVKMQSFDFDQIFADFANSIKKDSLTREEKQMAILNHVLERDD
jgi:hypothetical protein